MLKLFKNLNKKDDKVPEIVNVWNYNVKYNGFWFKDKNSFRTPDGDEFRLKTPSELLVFILLKAEEERTRRGYGVRERIIVDDIENAIKNNHIPYGNYDSGYKKDDEILLDIAKNIFFYDYEKYKDLGNKFLNKIDNDYQWDNPYAE